MELNDTILSRISLEAAVKPEQVKATVALLADQATVPFIARYRKEVTANLDEVQIHSIATKNTNWKTSISPTSQNARPKLRLPSARD
jgi:transcriptional accessory protein Tex/SPT6